MSSASHVAQLLGSPTALYSVTFDMRLATFIGICWSKVLSYGHPST